MPHENEPDSQNTGTQQQSAEEQIGNMVNAAVAAHLRRFTEKTLPGILEGALKPITEKLSAPPPVADEGDKKKGKQQDPELLAMAKRLEDMQKAMEAEQAKAAAAEKAARDQKAYGDLRGALDGKVRPELVDFVAKHLMHVEGRLDFDESGAPLFKATRAPFAGADPEEIRLPLRAGIEDYLKSEAAKPFLPAPSGAGATQLPKRAGAAQPTGADFSKPATSDADKIRRAQERVRLAEERGVKQ